MIRKQATYWLPLLLATSCQALSANLQASPSVVGAELALLSVMLETEQTVPDRGGFRISIPTQFDSQTFECKVLEPQSVSVRSCSIEDSTDAILTLNGSIGAYEQVYIEVSGAHNPRSTSQNINFQVSSFDTSKNSIEMADGLSLVQFNPASLTEFEIKPESDRFGETTALSIEMKIGIEIPCLSDRSGCSVKVSSPIRNPYTSSIQRETVFDQEVLQCQVITNAEVSTEVQCAIQREVLQIFQLKSGTINIGETLRLRIEGFNNPLFPRAIDGFMIKTLDSLGGLIEQTASFGVSVQTPALITDASLRLLPASSPTSSTKVLEKSELLLDFVMPLPLETGCKISVQIPADFTQVYQEVSKVQVYGMFGFIRSLPFTVRAPSTIEIRDACLSYTENYIEAKIRIKHVVNPSSVRDTEPFIILVHDSTGQLLAQTSGDSFVVPASQFDTADFVQLSIEASNPIVQEESSLRVSFQTSNKLSADAMIKIEFPAEVQISDQCNAQTITVQTMRASFTCSSSQFSHIILISDLFYSYGYDPLIDKVLKIDFQNIIAKNPTSVTPDLSFTVTSYDLFDGNYSPVDSKQLAVPQFNQAGALQEVDIVFDQSISNYFPAEATVSLIANHETVEGHALVKIGFAEDFSFMTQSSFEIRAISGFIQTEPDFHLIDSQTIEIENLAALKKGDKVEFKITQIQLPRYQGQVNEPLVVSVVESSTGNDIDVAEFEYFVQEAASWDILSLSLSSHQSGSQTELSVSFGKEESSIMVSPEDSLVFGLPAEVSVDLNTLSCRLHDTEKHCQYNQLDHNILVHELCTQATKLESIGSELFIDGLTNPKSTRPLKSFSFNLKDRESRVVIKGDSLVWQTSEPAALQIKLEQVSTEPITATSYIFKPIVSGALFETTNVLLSFPECMSFSEEAKSTLRVEDFNGMSHQVSFISDQVLQITQPRTSITEIILKPIVNPTEQCLLSAESAITVSTYEDSDFEHVQSTLVIKPSLECADTCLSCLLTDKSACTSCTDGLYLSEDNRCVAECPAGFLNHETTAQCIKCSAECAECSGKVDNCLACAVSGETPSETGQCELVCPQGTYPFEDSESVGVECEKCDSPCATCYGEPDLCNSCEVGWKFASEGDSSKCIKKIDDCQGEEECEESSSSASFFEVAKGLLLDLKCTYSMTLFLIVLLLVKLTCKRKTGLLVGLVIVAATFETLSLFALLWQIFLVADTEDEMTREESLVFQIAPLSFLGVFLILNICITRQYLRAIRRPLDESEEDKATVADWSGKIFSCSRITCLLASVLFSFHNTAWLNICGQLPLTLKRRLFMHGFTIDYTRASKLSNILPRVFIQLYGVYFGVFESLGHLKDTGNKMATLDFTLVSCIHMFVLLLALNFQWSSKALTSSSQGALTQQATDQGKVRGLFKARNSIALHNLRLSAADKKALEAKAMVKKSHSAMNRASVVHSSATLKNYFIAEKHQASIGHSKRYPISTEVIKKQNNNENDERSSSTPLDFSFFHKARNSFIRKISRNNNYSAGTNQTVKSTFQKHTRKLDAAGSGQNKRRSQDLLSPKRLVGFHSRIDDSFGQRNPEEDSENTRSQIELKQYKAAAAVGSQQQLVRDFTTVDETLGQTTTFDATMYSSNEQLVSPMQTNVSKRPSLILTSKLASQVKQKSVLINSDGGGGAVKSKSKTILVSRQQSAKK